MTDQQLYNVTCRFEDGHSRYDALTLSELHAVIDTFDDVPITGCTIEPEAERSYDVIITDRNGHNSLTVVTATSVDEATTIVERQYAGVADIVTAVARQQ